MRGIETLASQDTEPDGWNGVYEGNAAFTLDGQPATYQKLCKEGLGHVVGGPVVPGPRTSVEYAGQTLQRPQTVPDTSIFFG